MLAAARERSLLTTGIVINQFIKGRKIIKLLRQVLAKLEIMTTEQENLRAELGRTNVYSSQIAEALTDIAGDQNTFVTALMTANAEIARLGGNQVDQATIDLARQNADALGTLATAATNLASAFPAPSTDPVPDPVPPADDPSNPSTDTTPLPDPAEAPGQEPVVANP